MYAIDVFVDANCTLAHTKRSAKSRHYVHKLAGSTGYQTLRERYTRACAATTAPKQPTHMYHPARVGGVARWPTKTKQNKQAGIRTSNLATACF